MELNTGAEWPEKAGIMTRPSIVNTGGASAIETGCGLVGAEPTWQTVQVAASCALLCVCQRPVAAAANNTANIAVKNISEARRDLLELRVFMAVAFQPPISHEFYTGSVSPSRQSMSKSAITTIPVEETATLEIRRASRASRST